MKNFINKLELAFDKQLADKTNYGRNQVKELFLRACIEVLAEQPEYIGKASDFEHIQKVGRVNRVSETLSKEGEPSINTELEDNLLLLQGNRDYPPKAKILRYNSFAFNEVEDAVFIQYCKAPGYDEYMFEVYGHDMEFLVQGSTAIENPSEDEMIQLYLFYTKNPPF